MSQTKPLKKVALKAGAVAERAPGGQRDRQSPAAAALNITRKRPIPGSPSAEALAPGVGPTPEHNLRFRGGRTIQSLTYVNLYVGGQAAWAAADIQNIDQALSGTTSGYTHFTEAFARETVERLAG
jgi:hypothetical protein